MKNRLNKEQIKDLKISGQILRSALEKAKNAIKPGVTTFVLNEIAEQEIKNKNALPAFKGYKVSGLGEYPASLCVSINDEIVHGIPDKKRIIKDGDVVSLDLGVNYKGMFTDAALTVIVREAEDNIKKLVQTTKECLALGIAEAHLGNKIGAIGNAIEKHAIENGFLVFYDLVGHGVGVAPHTWPHIPNFGQKDQGPLINEGMALAIEPMLSMGMRQTQPLKNPWVIATADGSISAHFEHTVIIENGKPTIVT